MTGLVALGERPRLSSPRDVDRDARVQQSGPHPPPQERLVTIPDLPELAVHPRLLHVLGVFRDLRKRFPRIDHTSSIILVVVVVVVIVVATIAFNAATVVAVVVIVVAVIGVSIDVTIPSTLLI